MGLAVVAVLPFIAFGGSAVAASTITMAAGGGEPGYAVNIFLPSTATVKTGDTIHWTAPWKEPHTVTFGEPTGDPTVPSTPAGTPATYDGTGFVSSGFIGTEFVFGPPGTPPSPDSFDLTFTKAGTYDFYCVIHPLMTGTITVVDSGTVSTQAELDAAAAAAYAPALAGLKAVSSDIAAKPVAVSTKPGGGNEYTVVVSGATADGDVNQFFPPAVNIKEGDSILWKNTTQTPHTVTFNPQLFQGDPTNAQADAPASFDGTGLANSGTIGDGWVAGQTFELAFSKAGTYNYICLLHASQGMVGAVNVAAAPATPTPTTPTATPTTQAPAPPNTGSGTASGSTDSTWLVAGALALLLATSGGAVFAVKRH